MWHESSTFLLKAITILHRVGHFDRHLFFQYLETLKWPQKPRWNRSILGAIVEEQVDQYTKAIKDFAVPVHRFILSWESHFNWSRVALLMVQQPVGPWDSDLLLNHGCLLQHLSTSYPTEELTGSCPWTLVLVSGRLNRGCSVLLCFACRHDRSLLWTLFAFGGAGLSDNTVEAQGGCGPSRLRGTGPGPFWASDGRSGHFQPQLFRAT